VDGVGSRAFTITGSATIIIMGTVFPGTTIITSPFVAETEMGLGRALDSALAGEIINSLLRAGLGLA
jgi:hypothetical protein